MAGTSRTLMCGWFRIIQVFVKPIICALKALKIEKNIVFGIPLNNNIQNNQYEVIIFCLEKCEFLSIF